MGSHWAGIAAFDDLGRAAGHHAWAGHVHCGVVDSKDMAERAGEVAGRVSGVREVKNALVVK